jgi:hypothetical protein
LNNYIIYFSRLKPYFGQNTIYYNERPRKTRSYAKLDLTLFHRQPLQGKTRLLICGRTREMRRAIINAVFHELALFRGKN